MRIYLNSKQQKKRQKKIRRTQLFSFVIETWSWYCRLILAAASPQTNIKQRPAKRPEKNNQLNKNKKPRTKAKKVDYWKVLFILCVYYALRLPNNDHGQKYFVYWTLASHVNCCPACCPRLLSSPWIAAQHQLSAPALESVFFSFFFFWLVGVRFRIVVKGETSKIMRCRSFYRLSSRHPTVASRPVLSHPSHSSPLHSIPCPGPGSVHVLRHARI